MVAFTKSGIVLIELTHVPLNMVSDVGRVDMIDGNMIVTYFQWQPGEDGHDEAVVVAKIGIPHGAVPDAVQFELAALARAGLRVFSRKPPVVN